VNTPSNSLEGFLARALRRRSSRLGPFGESLLNLLIFFVRVAVVAAILIALYAYVSYCVTFKCAGAECPAKTAEASHKATERAPAQAAKSSKTTTGDVQYVWVQLMPDQDKTNTPGGRLVRTIGPPNGSCPTIAQGGKTLPMYQRPPAVRAAFPILLCERVLIDNGEARIGSFTLPARIDEPNNIVVIGDTGCRMVYWQIQPCRVDDGWPFAKVADSALKQVKANSFILHVGDFHYREDPCIDSSTDCGTSPFGDNWDTWKTEFFEPARKLLEAAPWVIMRGNHEDCARAGAGWIFLFGLPGQYDSRKACDDKAQMYQINVGKTDETLPRPRLLVVMDTADEKNPYRMADNCKQYQDLLEQLKPETGREVWLAMHQPLWGRNMAGEQELTDQAEENMGPWNFFRASGVAFDCREAASPLAVFRDKLKRPKHDQLARLVIAGDTHAFQFFWPRDGLTPIQIITGNGGTKLDGLKTSDGKRLPDKNPPKVTEVTSLGIDGMNLTLVQFGFTVMRRDGTIWSATQLDRNGNTMAVCQFSEAPPATSSDLTNCEVRTKDPPSN
jgi:hypothetical protein